MFFCASGLCVASLFQVSDTGQYVCKATNVAGQVDKNFHLNIYGNFFLNIVGGFSKRKKNRMKSMCNHDENINIKLTAISRLFLDIIL